MNPMQWKALVLAIFAVFCAPQVVPGLGVPQALAVMYEWIGDCAGNSDAWDCNENWEGSCGGLTCYPNTTGDDASIGIDAHVCLIDETIDDLATVGADVTFDDCDSSDPVLAVDSLNLGTGNETSAVITFSNGAKITND